MDSRERYHDVLHNIRTGIRYHLHRQAFFERWHRLTGVISLVFSSAAVVAFIQEARLASVAAAVVAIAQAVDLMFETRKHADLHRDLRKRYTTLEPEVVALLDGLDPDQYKGFKTAIASIEVDEPPVRETLIKLSQNEAARVTGFSEKECPDTFSDLNWFQRHLPNIF